MTNKDGDEMIEDRLEATWWDYTPVTTTARRLVFGDRARMYGHPIADFSDIAGLWSAYKGISFTSEDVGLMMLLLKVSRQKMKPGRDHLVDAAGYAECVQRIVEARSHLDGCYDDYL